TYQVDVDHGVINHFVEGSIFPNMEGTQQKRFYELGEDELILKTPSFKVGGERATGVITWERVK
ncbi:MAG TPA: lipocalin-like domain-containing protein, partial [Anaerolineales bacterium]|nr:lipocalin-like domain-containing protein [Anaerolineales bacterium]